MTALKKKLQNNAHLVGTMLNLLTHPDTVQILKSVGFDYFIVDTEHGYVDPSRIAALTGLAKALEIGIFVRIPEVSRTDILRLMEMGVNGLMLPNTNTADQARELVEHAKYAPLGNRGLSFMRGHNRYIPVVDQAAYMQQNNDETILIVQIETGQSVGNIREIMSVPGIDLAFIGPNDLCHSLGIPGQKTHPDYLAALETVITTCRDLGKHCGTQGMTAAEVMTWYEKGMTFNLYSTDVNIFYGAAKGALAQIER